MKRACIALLCGLATCRGYRDPGDSEALRAEIEDKNIATRVRIALGRDPATARYADLDVACSGGRVTIVGAVDRPAARDRVVEIAAGCEGVRSVRARVTVTSASE